MLFVFKSIEYRKQQCISSDRSDPKRLGEKDTALRACYLKWPSPTLQIRTFSQLQLLLN